MDIKLLYFDGCPHYEETLKLLKEVLQEKNVISEIKEINVAAYEGTEKLNFPGSPTIFINGKDIAPLLKNETDFALRCRIYNVDGKLSGLPSKGMISKAVKNNIN